MSLQFAHNEVAPNYSNADLLRYLHIIYQPNELMLNFHCLHCGQYIDADDSFAGKLATCPNCSADVQIPHVMATEAHQEPDPVPAPVAKNRKPSANRSKFRASNPYRATIGAACIVLVISLIRSDTLLEQTGFHRRDFASTIGEVLFGIIAAAVVAFIFALVTAGILAAFKHHFLTALSRSYSLGVLIVPTCSLVLALFGKVASNPTIARERQDAASSISETYRTYTIDGISIDLPRSPIGTAQNIPIPKGASQVLIKSTGYRLPGNDYAITIAHHEQKSQYPTNPKMAITGGIEMIKQVNGTTDFISETSDSCLLDIPAYETKASCNINGKPTFFRIFTVARDNHLYQIIIEGDSLPVDRVAGKIYKSLKFDSKLALKSTSNGIPSLSLQNIAGIKIGLPGIPKKAEIGTPSDAKANAVSQETYILQHGTTQYAVHKTEHYVMNDSLDDNAAGIVKGKESYSIVDMQIAGERAKRITLEINIENSQKQHVSILLFAKGKSLWQIATIDPSMIKAHGALDGLIPTISFANE